MTVIDRIDGDRIFITTAQGDTLPLARAAFEGDVREGDVLARGEGGLWCADPHATQARRRDMRALRDGIINRHKPTTGGHTPMTDYRNARIAQLVPYQAGEQPRDPAIIKLNTNENPFPPSPDALAAIADARAHLRVYPPGNADDLCAALAAHHGLAPDQVFCGNGSDEVLALAFLAFFGADRPLCTPAITYSFYPVYADLFAVPYLPIPMVGDEGLDVDVDALLGAGRAVALANPNAPTSIALPYGTVRRIAAALQARGQLLLLDEAYADFAREDAVSLVAEFDNLLIVRTLSKSYSLAGLRVGYALAQPPLIAALRTVRDSFNSYPLDVLAQAGAAAALRDEPYHQKTTRAIIDTRDRFADRLRQMGFVLPPSQTNFVFARHSACAGAVLYAHLREKNILVRHFAAPPIADFLRISIGTDAQMDAVAHALEQILAEVSPCS